MSGGPPSSLLKNAWFAAWGHAAYKISSEIGINCRPGALTGLLFQLIWLGGIRESEFEFQY